MIYSQPIHAPWFLAPVEQLFIDGQVPSGTSNEQVEYQTLKLGLCVCLHFPRDISVLNVSCFDLSEIPATGAADYENIDVMACVAREVDVKWRGFFIVLQSLWIWDMGIL